MKNYKRHRYVPYILRGKIHDRADKLCLKFDESKHPCPQCGRKVVMGKWWLYDGHLLLCVNPNCSWRISNDGRVLQDEAGLDEIEQHEIRLRNRKHRHVFVTIGERNICIKCGEWR